MKKITIIYFLYAAFLTVILIACEKEMPKINKLNDTPSEVYVPQDETFLNWKEKNYNPELNMQEVNQHYGIEKQTPSRMVKRTYRELPDPCDDPQLDIQPLIQDNIFIQEIQDDVCRMRVSLGRNFDTLATVTQSIRGNNEIYNCFIDGLVYCDDGTEIQAGNGTLFYVPEGQGNISPFQFEVKAKYKRYIRLYPGIFLPLYTVEVEKEDYDIYIMENIDHELNEVPYSGGFCRENYVPAVEVMPSGFADVGDRIELFWQAN